MMSIFGFFRCFLLFCFAYVSFCQLFFLAFPFCFFCLYCFPYLLLNSLFSLRSFAIILSLCLPSNLSFSFLCFCTLCFCFTFVNFLSHFSFLPCLSLIFHSFLFFFSEHADSSFLLFLPLHPSSSSYTAPPPSPLPNVPRFLLRPYPLPFLFSILWRRIVFITGKGGRWMNMGVYGRYSDFGRLRICSCHAFTASAAAASTATGPREWTCNDTACIRTSSASSLRCLSLYVCLNV